MNSSNAQTPGTQTAVKTDLHYKYLVYIPKGYGEANNKWPLIFFLHGAGERGSDINQVKKHGPPKLLDDPTVLENTLGKSLGGFNFVVVSPQCPENEWWRNNYLIEVMNEALSKYSIDKNRIYLTGLSMGGFGTWSFASEYPKLFAAIVPICGGGDAWSLQGVKNMVKTPIPAATLKNLVNIPVWAFHGADDPTVALEQGQKTVDALKALGGTVEFTIYPKTGHDSWTVTYNNPDVYKWFLKHTKTVNRVESGKKHQ